MRASGKPGAGGVPVAAEQHVDWSLLRGNLLRLHFADTIWQRKNVKALFGGPESFQKKDDSPLVFPAFPLSAGLRGVLWGKH